MPKKAVLAGGSGFLGQALARELRSRGYEVVLLTRQPRARRGDGVREVGWGAGQPAAWAQELEGAAVLVNFTGRSVNCVHTAENRQAILGSRLDAVRVLGAAVRGCACPPSTWVQCSATGYYGDGGGRWCDEQSAPGRGFMAEVCRQWEEAFDELALRATRKITLRIGVVLGRRGGAYPPLARITRWFLGGAAGDGRQGISWIHLDDLCGIFLQAIEQDWRGTYNACAPEPATNTEFMRMLRCALHRPWAPPTPAFAVRLAARWLLRTDGDLILRGPRCLPRRALEGGFRFNYGTLRSALEELAAR